MSQETEKNASYGSAKVKVKVHRRNYSSGTKRVPIYSVELDSATGKRNKLSATDFKNIFKTGGRYFDVAEGHEVRRFVPEYRGQFRVEVGEDLTADDILGQVANNGITAIYFVSEDLTVYESGSGFMFAIEHTDTEVYTYRVQLRAGE